MSRFKSFGTPSFLVLAGAIALLLVAPPAPLAGEVVHGRGLLWKVERPGLAPSYLFGTMHVTDQRVLSLPPEVEAAFTEARSATFELILNDEGRMTAVQSMVLTDGRRLETILGPELFGRTVAAGQTYGLGPAQLNHFKPWAVASILSLPRAELARTGAGAQPLDTWLQTEALRQNKPIFALETLAEQLALFDGLPAADQIAMLATAVEASAKLEAVFEAMIGHYLARDTGALHALADTQGDALAESNAGPMAESFMFRFIDARNRVMAERMTES
ncbi:MAG: TraB/GumN family protein, partial [Kiloniellales bacterium]